MTFTLIHALIAFAAFTLLFLVRVHWVVWQIERYRLLANWYCIRTLQGEAVRSDMGDLWPSRLVLHEVWHWGWRRYVVDQGHYDAMNRWLVAELQRTDLDADTFAAETMASELEMDRRAAPPDSPAPAAATPPPADPSRN